MTRSFLHVFSTFAPGGPQVRTVRLMAAFGAELRHTVCAMDGCTDALALVEPGLDVRAVGAPPRGTLAAVPALRRVVRAAAPDLLCTYNWGAIEAVMAGRTLGVPMLHHEDGFLPDEDAGFKRRRTWTRRAVLRWPREVVVPSHRLHGIATGLWRLERVRLVPNGVRPEEYAPRDGAPTLRARLGIPLDALVIGAVGHLRREKAPVRAVHALARMRAPAHLLLVGDGPERAAVEAAAREHGVAARVHLAGHVADPREHYRGMDVFTIPSDTEQMPVALLEAMASGLPVAATDVGDVARMVPPAGRELVSGRDADALARSLDRLAADAGLRAALGAAGRAKVTAEYSFERMVAAYRVAYRAACGLESG